MPRHEVPEAGADGWTKWITPIMRGYRLGCCDCGLVHNVRFRVLRVTRRYGKGVFASTLCARTKNLRVEMKISRNERATSQMRRHMRGKKAM
jgi:hypothetical protein